MKLNTRIALIMVLACGRGALAQFAITIDAQRDSFYQQLTGPSEGFLVIPHDEFLPLSGPRPAGDADLSAQAWAAWDEDFFYFYVEVRDEAVIVNHPSRPQNDCLELKFDPDPRQKARAGVVNARLSALDSAAARNRAGVDNLYSEGDLAAQAASPRNYARRRTQDGYALELRLAWRWISVLKRRVPVGVGNIFGLAINVHDNDSDHRDGSIQWAPGRADEVWNTPQLLGTVEFLADHKLKFIRQNFIAPHAAMGKTYLSAARLRHRPGREFILENWRYHPGDSAVWADPACDDRSWEVTFPRLTSAQKPESGWPGVGWFRLHVEVDSSLWAVPLAFAIRQTGASEVYLNGKRLFHQGRVGRSRETERTEIERNPRVIAWAAQKEQVLAVRYSNFSTAAFNQLGVDAGFACLIWEDVNARVAARTQDVRTLTIYQMVFSVVPIVLALLHLFLYLFDVRARVNLYFAICMFCWAVIVFEDLHFFFIASVWQMLGFESVSLLVTGPAIVFGLLTAYASVYHRPPRQIAFFIIAGVLVTIWGWLSLWGVVATSLRTFQIILYVYLALAALEVLRIFVVQVVKREQARWIMGAGLIALMLALVYQLLIGMGMVAPVGQYGVVYIYGVLVLSICVSVDLSRNYAQTNRRLEQQLVQVQELSQKALTQERHAKEQELARRLLEADNARKTQELEEAREFQLSLLPKMIPVLPQVEIATFMRPATEVGGDYYDFHLAADGTLTVAIGDATGHGMKAGTMVASVKSLFTAYGDRAEVGQLLGNWSAIIREMHLDHIYMAMALIRITGRRMIVSAAGMPPLLIYRHATAAVEEVVLKGMPLGGPGATGYQERQTTLARGDTVLLMSDGFPELFNAENEMLDSTRVRQLYEETASRSAAEIIRHLVAGCEQWQNGKPQNDDITFVVLKFK
ncbi:SpoIIE family protein phosphatase [candidate division KSB1 bacterium]|nr:SpoIIE family protein phosphatase [bacterium]NUM64334.1 SpoIIE family protein phosphatase [candidate division KSB1 bacterium]